MNREYFKNVALFTNSIFDDFDRFKAFVRKRIFEKKIIIKKSLRIV